MLKKGIHNIYRKARSPFKATKLLVKKRLGWLGVPLILPYTAYGDKEKVFITGAVIEDKGLAKPTEEQKLWKNILAMVKRYSGDEIAGVRVRIDLGDISETVMTNEKGLFHTVIPAGGESHLPREVRFTLMDEVVEDQGTVEAIGKVFEIQENAEFLVVSDIDDTVIVSHSTRFWKKIRLMLFKNALTRSPFEGVAAFYRALHTPRGKPERMIFYVSGSEWNLHDLLVDFFEFRNIPRGPLLLSDTKTKIFKLLAAGNTFQHKTVRIRELFEFYHDHEFILIGDSGQRDPEIYLRILKMFPSRVKAIYIRHIGKKNWNKRYEDLIEEAAKMNVELIPVNNTLEAARHAAGRGFIDKSEIEKISTEKFVEQQQEETV